MKKRLACLTLVILAGSYCGILRADPLRYAIKPKQVIPYDMTIQVTTPTAVETMKGVIVFSGITTQGDVLTVEYSGGLSKTSKSTVRQSGPPRGGFGRPGGPPIPRGPFDRPDYRGLVPAKCNLVLSTTGEIKSMSGDSQLPFLLGNLALLPFETLPAQDVKEWQDGNALTITTRSSNSRFGPRFGPFANDDAEKIKNGGGENVNYRITSDDGENVTVSKTYSLTSPAATKDETGFETNGTGTWVFNRKLGASESMDFKMEMKVSGDNTTTAYPITIAYRRMTDEQYAEHQKNVAEQRAARETQLAEMQAKAKAKAEAAKAAGPTEPKAMNPTFKRGTIFQLKSPVWQAARSELQKLAKSNAAGMVKEDMDVLTLVGQLRAHKQKEVRDEAEKVWEKWKSSFAEHATDDQKAAVAKAVGEEPATVMTEENPFVVEGDEDDGRGQRTWSDQSGKFKIEGEFEKLQGSIVLLKNKEGKTIRVPKSRLSSADQQLIEKLSK